MLGIKENKLDFEVLPLKNPKFLAIYDLSDYMEFPKQPILKVTLPGYTKPIFLPFKKDSINKYNSNHLQPRENSLVLNDLPDGIYKISYHIHPHDEEYIEKNVLITSVFDRNYSQFLLSLEDADCAMRKDRNIMFDILEVNLAIDTAQSHLEEGNIRAANDHYQGGTKLLEKLTKKLKGCY